MKFSILIIIYTLKDKMQNDLKRLLGITLMIIVLMPKNGTAQQDPVFNQYMNNLQTVQPAYAGTLNNVNVTAMSRIQWVGFDGAPTTNSLSVISPVAAYNFGIGLSLINDKFGPVRQNGLYVDYAYRIQTGRDSYISLGVKGGVNRYEALLSDLPVHDPNDPLAVQDITQKLLPNFGFGAMVYNENCFLGLSVPKFFKNKINAESGTQLYAEEINFYLMGGIVFPLSRRPEDLKLKVTGLYRESEMRQGIFDLTANVMFYERVWVGASYRFQNSYGLLLQVYIDNNKSIKLGYAYDLTTFNQSQSNSGTHEFMISYDLPILKRRGCCNKIRYF